MSEIFNYINKEDTEASFILSPAIEALDNMNFVMSGPRGNAVLWSVDFAAWSAQNALHNLGIYGLKPGLPVAIEMKSPYIDAIRKSSLDDNWFGFFEEIYNSAREQNLGKYLENLNKGLDESLESIFDKTGINSEITLNHSPFMLGWALKNSLQGVTIVAFDFDESPENRKFDVWDSRLNRERDIELIEDLVTKINEKVPQEIGEPITAH